MSEGLRAKISDELKAAMKAGEKLKVSTLRLVGAAIKDRDIQNRTAGPDSGVNDAQIVEVLAKMVKQRQESVAIYQQGGRPELAEAGERSRSTSSRASCRSSFRRLK